MDIETTQVPLKVLCVMGQFQYGDPARGLGVEYDAFLPALKNIGCDVCFFDSRDRHAYQTLAHLNKAFVSFAKNSMPDLILVVPNEDEIWAESLKELSATLNCRIAAWMTDDSFKFDWYSKYVASCYDLVVTTHKPSVSKYHSLDIMHVALSQWGTSSARLRSPVPAVECRYSCSFVGAANNDRRRKVDELRCHGLQVDCFGHGWPSGALSTDEMFSVIRSSVVSLNFPAANWKPPFQFGAISSQLKARTFEVPGAGGCLVTLESPDIDDYYIRNREIAVASNCFEMAQIANELLTNHYRRDNMANAGFLKTASEHTYERRLKAVIDEAMNMDQRYSSGAISSVDWEAIECKSCFETCLSMGLSAAACLFVGRKRSTRAARRLVLEFDVRTRKEVAFSKEGWAGKLFPHYDGRKPVIK